MASLQASSITNEVTVQHRDELCLAPGLPDCHLFFTLNL